MSDKIWVEVLYEAVITETRQIVIGLPGVEGLSEEEVYDRAFKAAKSSQDKQLILATVSNVYKPEPRIVAYYKDVDGKPDKASRMLLDEPND